IMQLLLHHGLSTCAINSNGRTALHKASSQGNHISSGSMSTLRLLLDRGIDLESRDIQGRTPVLRAADYGRESRYQYVIELINRGADINAKDDGG
ncbi:ankyrin repeat-containing domain protein, partial [Leptodontidium sp. 2 PMI_412]